MAGWDDEEMDLSAYPKRTSTDPSSPEYIGFAESVPGKLHGKDIKYYNVPRGLRVYNGNNYGRPTRTPNQIQWFGFNPIELETYGKLYVYEVADDLKFIDMGDAQTLASLYGLAPEESDSNVRKYLVSEYGYNPAEPNRVGLRQSDNKPDAEVAQFLQRQLEGTEYKGYILVGAFTRSEFSPDKKKPFHPEMCFVIEPATNTHFIEELKEDKRKPQERIPEIPRKKTRGRPTSPLSPPPRIGQFNLQSNSPISNMNMLRQFQDSPPNSPISNMNMMGQFQDLPSSGGSKKRKTKKRQSRRKECKKRVSSQRIRRRSRKV